MCGNRATIIITMERETAMDKQKDLLTVHGLKVQFETRRGTVTAVDDVSFSVAPGRALCIVGESGCGKSVTSLAILGLLGKNGHLAKGSIEFDGRELTRLSEGEMCGIRGNEIAMIFQDPMTALNPTQTIGRQLSEPLMLHQGLDKKAAWSAATDMLNRVGISAPEKRMREYPHQMSGGMRQRVMIAMALCCSPKLLIADEPTTALDVTIQAQILRLIRKLQKESGAAVVLITHDMGVVAETANDVLVLYAGSAMEAGPVERIFDHPLHPYTRGLLASIPQLDRDQDMLNTIEGTVPPAYDMPTGCHFCPRCPNALPICENKKPRPVPVQDGGMVACWLYEEASEHE